MASEKIKEAEAQPLNADAPPAFNPGLSQPGYPLQPSFPSDQPGYPPQQPGYTPQQPGYPPQQPGFPPQQPGYPPQQPGYPPQQPGYPPQQPGYPPQQPGFPAAYPSGQPYPQVQPGYPQPGMPDQPGYPNVPPPIYTQDGVPEVKMSSNKYSNYIGAAAIGCCITICCGWMCGLAAVILAFVSRHQQKNHKVESARKTLKASFICSLIGFIFGIIALIILVVLKQNGVDSQHGHGRLKNDWNF